MTRRQRRLTIIGGSLAVLAVAAALVLNAMRDSIVFFSTPSMVAEKHIQAGRRFRLGGFAEGALDSSGAFKADTVLAKHDETYMPKEVADALKKQGHWKDDYAAKSNAGASQTAQGAPQGVKQ
jgi:cytochrome c-type biogenesis protein CcmE